MDFDGLKETVMQMVGGARCPVDVDMFQNDLTSMKGRDDELTLLVHLGYRAYDAMVGAVQRELKSLVPAMAVGESFTEDASGSGH